MSNNLVSQQLSIPKRQMGQMEPVSDKIDSSVLNLRMGMMGPTSDNPSSHQFAVSNQQMGLGEPMPSFSGSHNLTASNMQMGQMELKVANLGPQQLVPNQKVGEMEAMLSIPGSQKLLLPSKRKVAVEPFNNSLPKRVTQMEPLYNSPGLPQLHAPNKKTVQMQSIVSTSGSRNLPAPNKRMVRNESISSKSGSQRLHTPKNRTAQMELSPKVQTESFEAVRSKMRESLASALALVYQHQDKAPVEEKSSREAAITTLHAQEDSQPSESTYSPADAADLPDNRVDTMPSKETYSTEKPNDSQSTLSETSTNESLGNSAQTWKSSRRDQCNTILPDGDVSFSDNFFVEDELLQGNGLSWALDIDMQAAERKEVQTAEKPNLLHVDAGGDGDEQCVASSQNLAFKIEAELFKLFGGVNKKYKEKGRSLMFNLKDRSNPELRERVMSGEISPERLCAMTAEELASKELSQWRMAKAEELAQMIVLPDSEVDIRRLVKKTHKGEYQVEVEQDDGISVEVSVGTTSFTPIRPKDNELGAHPSSETDEIEDTENATSEKNSPENQDPSCSITIPTDGTDLMQVLIVDELKDTEFLPPIVSLDEFMESLYSEPPFENLPVDDGQTKPVSDKDDTETDDRLVASDPPSRDPVDANPGKDDKINLKYTEVKVNMKSSQSPVERKTSPPASLSTAEHVWEGVLQLNVSSLITVVGFYRSGEKTSTKEWPSPLEIKGRVRLDAFEKFIQELPMSRSRAVMVAHFVLKEGSSENERAGLSEAVDSYVSDERLGLAEPAPGVEIYFCPTHPRILEMLNNRVLSKDQTQILNSTDNGLIGVVVWRKAHLNSIISPNSSSRHKHSSKKQHITSRRHQEKDNNVNVNLTSKAPIPSGQPFTKPGYPPITNDDGDDNDDDDDIPPGFGPIASRDEDDLPEFNFSGNLNSTIPKFSFLKPLQGSRMTPQSPRPVDQMRELVHKYGRIGNDPGLGIKKWNDDDDEDDIPEWQPRALQQQPRLHPQMHGFNQPMQPHMVNQYQGSTPPPQLMVPVGLPVVTSMKNVAPSLPRGGARWGQPTGPHGLQPSMLGSQPNTGQHYGVPLLRAGQPQGGTDWRRDHPRSRGV